MINNKIMIAGICICLLFISGCGGIASNNNKDTVEDFRRGTAGLDMSFLDVSGNAELFQDSVFSIGVELHNEGAYDITQGKLLLFYDSQYVGFDSDTNTNFELFGKSELYTKGEERAFFFSGKTKKLVGESFGQELRIGAVACYPYESVFVDFVCIDRPYSKDIETGNKLCAPSDLRSSGQGGPVAVTAVDVSFVENSAGVKPYFDITISHKGRGLVTHPDSYVSQCSKVSSVGSLNKVVLKSATLSDVGLDCNSRVISLTDGSARVRCTTFSEILTQVLPIESPLQIELAYGYAQTESVDIKIVR